MHTGSSGLARTLNTRFKALAWVVLAYVVAVAAALALLQAWPWGGWPGWPVLAADVLATLVVFGFSWAVRNSSVYDGYWSVIPPLVAVWLLAQPAAANGHVGRQLLVLLVVWLWGVRLSWNWLRGWPSLTHEDWRYRQFQAKLRRGYWLFSLGGLHLFPTLTVFLGMLPLFGLLAPAGAQRPWGWPDDLFFFFTLAAVVLEAVADAQMWAHRRRTDAARPAFYSRGLWAWSRHPNYLGECLFWTGLALWGLYVFPNLWWQVLGAVAMFGLFYGYSIPAMDRRQRASKPGFEAYARHTPALLPWRRPRRNPLWQQPLPLAPALQLRSPASAQEWEAYYDLRYTVLREPWGQSRETNTDAHEDTAHHLMALGPDGRVLGVGRVQFNHPHEAQVRFMAVHPQFRGQSIGAMVLQGLEAHAWANGAQVVVLHARESAVAFYERQGYVLQGPSHRLFGQIQHYLMHKPAPQGK